ncbi:hypothetical protein [Streptosporangium sp. NPDC003464]
MSNASSIRVHLTERLPPDETPAPGHPAASGPVAAARLLADENAPAEEVNGGSHQSLSGAV